MNFNQLASSLFYIIFADYLCRIPNSHTIGRNILGHYTSRTYNATVANSYPGTNNSATANPAIFTYRHRIGILLLYTPLQIIKRVLRGINLHTRTYQRICSNSDITTVQKSTIGVDKDMFSKAETCQRS